MSEERKNVCIIAWPAGHSRSPLIHNYWIKQHNLNAEYRREAVPPEQLADFIAHLREHGYIGGNVTVPHKQAVLALCEPDERAKAVGAANCLWYEGDTLRSTNTDVEGFLANLDADHAGLGPRPGNRRGARRRRRRARGGVRADPAQCRAHLCDQPHDRARGSVEKEIRRARARRQVGGNHRPVGRRRASGQHHDVGHGWAAAAGDQSALSGLAGGGGPGLCAAGDRPAESWRASAACAPPTGSACCCIRRCAASNAGSASSPK